MSLHQLLPLLLLAGSVKASMPVARRSFSSLAASPQLQVYPHPLPRPRLEARLQFGTRGHTRRRRQRSGNFIACASPPSSPSPRPVDDKWTKLIVCLLIDFIGMSTVGGGGVDDDRLGLDPDECLCFEGVIDFFLFYSREVGLL